MGFLLYLIVFCGSEIWAIKRAIFRSSYSIDYSNSKIETEFRLPALLLFEFFSFHLPYS